MPRQRIPLPEAGCGTHLWSSARVEARFQRCRYPPTRTREGRLRGGDVGCEPMYGAQAKLVELLTLAISKISTFRLVTWFVWLLRSRRCAQNSQATQPAAWLYF